MDFSLSSSLVGSAVSNPDGLALDLQFAADKTLTARKGPTPAFIRTQATSTGSSYVGSDGLIQYAAANQARFDHDPVTLACKGLLIEEQRTNASLYSGAIVNGTGWNTAETTLTASGTGPDSNTAYQISETAISFGHSLINTGTTTVNNGTSTVLGTVYTASIFLKKVAGSVNWVQLTLGAGGFGTSQYANFNLSTGLIGLFTGLTAGTVPRIEAFPNGWYRCSITCTATATTTTSAGTVIAFTNNTNATARLLTYLGSTSNSLLATMCQFETGSFATSYIPTTTASAVRSADVCSITGATAASLISSTEGSWGINFVSAGYGAGVYGNAAFLMSVAGDNGNRIGVYQNPNGAVSSEGSSSNTTRFSLVNTSSVNTPHKLSFAYKVGETSSQFVDNSAPTSTATNTAFVMPAFTSLRIGSQQMTSADYMNGTISSFRYYRKRLPTAKLQTITV